MVLALTGIVSAAFSRRHDEELIEYFINLVHSSKWREVTVALCSRDFEKLSNWRFSGARRRSEGCRLAPCLGGTCETFLSSNFSTSARSFSVKKALSQLSARKNQGHRLEDVFDPVKDAREADDKSSAVRVNVPTILEAIKHSKIPIDVNAENVYENPIVNKAANVWLGVFCLETTLDFDIDNKLHKISYVCVSLLAWFPTVPDNWTDKRCWMTLIG